MMSNGSRSYEKTFEWLDFPQGRVRYAGTQRGRDEPPIRIFAVEICGWIYYGEIRELFLADRNKYNLEIVSFGWTKHDWFGTEPDPQFCAAFAPGELSEVQSLICQAVSAWRKLEDRPAFLIESARSHFMGAITFLDGWALVNDGQALERKDEEYAHG